MGRGIKVRGWVCGGGTGGRHRDTRFSSHYFVGLIPSSLGLVIDFFLHIRLFSARPSLFLVVSFRGRDVGGGRRVGSSRPREGRGGTRDRPALHHSLRWELGT